MDKSYIKSDEETTLLGLWVLFFTLSIIFLWLIYEIYVSLIMSLPTDGSHLLIL